jgi:hypothetical protein
MKKTISVPGAAVRPDQRGVVGATGLSYRPDVAAPRRALFAVPVDLQTLVIAEALRRKAQAEIQRDGLRDARYEMPVPAERQRERERERESDLRIPSFEDDE